MKVFKPVTDNSNSSAFYLIYGASGTRKSTLCGTIGELGKVLIVDADQGYHTYAHCPYLKKEWTDNIMFTDFDTFADFDILYQMIAKKDWKKIDDFEPQWIVLDTYSAMETSLMRKISSLSQLKNSDSLTGFQDKYGYSEWGMLKEYHLKYLRAMKALVHDIGINIVYVMQENLDKDELSGQTYGGPRTSGKAWIEFPEAFDVVIHCTMNMSGDANYSTVGKGKWPAKNRLTGIGKDFKTDAKKPIVTLREIITQ